MHQSPPFFHTPILLEGESVVSGPWVGYLINPPLLFLIPHAHTSKLYNTSHKTYSQKVFSKACVCCRKREWTPMQKWTNWSSYLRRRREGLEKFGSAAKSKRDSRLINLVYIIANPTRSARLFDHPTPDAEIVQKVHFKFTIASLF